MKLRKVKSVYSEQQIRQYLHRVQFPGFENEQASSAAILPEPTLLTLSLLMHHHLQTFPFENTSIHYEPSHKVSIRPQDTFRRFVVEKKGGYCMNHNTIFLNVLRGLGFRGISSQGRVFSPRVDDENESDHDNDDPAELESKKEKPDFTWEPWSHMVLLVKLPNHLNPKCQTFYLVDVGFGSLGIQRPLLISNGHQERGRALGFHRLIREKFDTTSFDDDDDDQDDQESDLDQGGKEVQENQNVWKLQSRNEGDQDWKTHYCFILGECFQQDYECMNHWTSTSSSVVFTQTITLSLNFDDHQALTSESREKILSTSNLNPSLYPKHPFTIGQYTLIGDKFSIKSSGKETVNRQIQSERERIEISKKYFGLLADLEIQDAERNIGGRKSELKNK